MPIKEIFEGLEKHAHDLGEATSRPDSIQRQTVEEIRASLQQLFAGLYSGSAEDSPAVPTRIERIFYGDYDRILSQLLRFVSLTSPELSLDRRCRQEHGIFNLRGGSIDVVTRKEEDRDDGSKALTCYFEERTPKGRKRLSQFRGIGKLIRQTLGECSIEGFNIKPAKREFADRFFWVGREDCEITLTPSALARLSEMFRPPTGEEIERALQILERKFNQVGQDLNWDRWRAEGNGDITFPCRRTSRDFDKGMQQLNLMRELDERGIWISIPPRETPDEPDSGRMPVAALRQLLAEK